MPRAVDGIAFDVGNTLILDPFDAVLLAKSYEIKRALADLGYGFPKDEIVDAWTEANRKVNYRFIDHFYQEQRIIAHCLDLLKVEKKDKAGLATRLLIIYRSGLKTAVTSDGRIGSMQRVLSELRDAGKRLVVFGNGRQRSIDISLAWMGLSGYFQVATASEKIGIEKPDPMAFKYVLKALETPASRSMYVGDDPANDIAPAKAAGMIAVRYVPPRQVSMPWRDYRAKSRRRPDRVIRSLEELLELVE